MCTRLLRQSDIVKLIDPTALNHTMRQAFCAYSREREIPGRRFYSPLSGPGDAMILAPGLSPGIPAYSVKVHAKFPEQIPAIRGVLLLNDLHTGALLATMDSTYITALRTGLGSAIATDKLARKDANRVAVIGAGTQGRFQLRYLDFLRTITSVTVFDTSVKQALTFVKQMSQELDMDISHSETLESALSDADIILCATWSKYPILSRDMVEPGCHITTLGADQPREAELSAELIKDAVFVCDDRDLALSMGAIGGTGLEQHWINAELGDVLSGNLPGRTSPEQITIYGAVGVAFQDLVTGWQVYEAALAHDVGETIDFLA